MLLRVKIVSVHSAVLLGHDHGACAAAPRVLGGNRRRGRRPSGRARRQRNVTVAMALKEEPESSRSGFAGGGPSWDPGLEIQVPFEQRPVNEYSALKDSILYSWAELSPGSFFLRLGSLWAGDVHCTRGPNCSRTLQSWKGSTQVCASSWNWNSAPGVIGGSQDLSGIHCVQGWSYVGDRLLSAVLPYEETGWYDGQMWVKPPEVLARDRLLGYYKIKPVINLLKQTLVGTGALLVGAVSLFAFAAPVEDFIHSLNQPTSAASKPSLRREELLRLPVQVIQDDDLAAAAAKAADGRPVYCRDRYYRALAGGQYCKWDDLLN